MKDWISQLADSEKPDTLAKQVQVHRASIRAVMMPELYERLVVQLRKDAARCTRELPRERRVAFVDGSFARTNILLRKQESYPTVDLDVELREGIIIKFSYHYRRTDTSLTREWGGIIRCEIDSSDMAVLSSGDQKFIDERELSQVLLRPLVDLNFVPPQEG